MAELHFDEPTGPIDNTGPWYRDMRGYHWFVLIVAALGWLFDCLDQQLFILARPAAMRELLSVRPDQFEEYSVKLKDSVPEGLSEQPVTAFLNDAGASLNTARRGEFWSMADSLQAAVAKSSSDSQLTAEIDKAREQLAEATAGPEFEAKVTQFSHYVTAIFLMGWATGGLIFGVMGDRIGRAKTMLITILMYSAFTGLSALSRGFGDFAFYRFLTGLGVGGEFAVGVALVAEVMPARARTATLTLLQMLSAIGNLTAAMINIQFGIMERDGLFASEGLLSSPWRAMFLVGAVPALLALVIRWKLKEPERWQQMSTEDAVAKQLGSYRALFGTPLWRKHALIGLALAFSGVVGLWAVGFFTPDLTKRVLRDQLTVATFESELQQAESDPQKTGDLLALIGEYRSSAEKDKNPTLAEDLAALESKWATATPAPAEADRLAELRPTVAQSIDGDVTKWGGVSAICFQVGAFFGMFGFGYMAQWIGRRPTFAIAFISSGLSTAAVFWFLDSFSQLFWLVPVMGFFQLSVFAGYAIYFPELFPTYLRSTGTSFCYNVGRFIAAIGPLVQAEIHSAFSEVGGTPLESMRYAGVIMCSVFLIGLFVLPFAPETKGKPLPE